MSGLGVGGTLGLKEGGHCTGLSPVVPEVEHALSLGASQGVVSPIVPVFAAVDTATTAQGPSEAHGATVVESVKRLSRAMAG